MIYLDPKKIVNKKLKLESVYTSSTANYVVIEKNESIKLKGKKMGRKFQVLSNTDIEEILNLAKKGLDFVII